MRIILIVFLLLLVFGCKHNEEVKQPPIKALGPVFAGVLGESMVYNDFVPDIDIDTLSNVTNKEHKVDVDLNRDGINDFNMLVGCTAQFFYMELLPINVPLNIVGYSAYQTGCAKTCSSCNSKVCSGRILSFERNQLINGDTVKWSMTSFTDTDGGKLTNDRYAYKYFYATDSTTWQPTPNQFIGFRFIENTDTLYGWMRVSIVGKAHILVHDCAYQHR